MECISVPPGRPSISRKVSVAPSRKVAHRAELWYSLSAGQAACGRAAGAARGQYRLALGQSSARLRHSLSRRALSASPCEQFGPFQGTRGVLTGEGGVSKRELGKLLPGSGTCSAAAPSLPCHVSIIESPHPPFPPPSP